MPATATAGAVTDAYRQRLTGLRESTAAAVAALLAGVDLDLDPAALGRAVDEWQGRSETLAASAGEQAASWSVAYLSSYLTASGAGPLSATVDPATPDTSGFSVVRGALFWRLGQGAGRAAAVQTATATAQRAARDAVGRAAGDTLMEGIAAEPQVDGWHRVTSSSCCGRCAALAGVRFRDRAAFHYAHPADRCTPEPTILGRAEVFRRQPPTVVTP